MKIEELVKIPDPTICKHFIFWCPGNSIMTVAYRTIAKNCSLSTFFFAVFSV